VGKADLSGAGALVPRNDLPDDQLIVPFYEVDLGNPFGNTTLYAVRNTSNSLIGLEIEYFGRDLVKQREDLVSLDPRETLPINIRDVAGLLDEGDGFSRGAVRIRVTSAPGTENLTGDFFTVDVAGNFASGERLITGADFCDLQEIRFLDFGSGTELWLISNAPQGSDEGVDPPTVTVTPIGEDGGTLAATDVFTDLLVLKLSASDFTALDFGTLLLDFSNSGGGYAYAKYSAEDKFSVGLNSACLVP
jgi:hypothetical protein